MEYFVFFFLPSLYCWKITLKSVTLYLQKQFNFEIIQKHLDSVVHPFWTELRKYKVFKISLDLLMCPLDFIQNHVGFLSQIFAYLRLSASERPSWQFPHEVTGIRCPRSGSPRMFGCPYDDIICQQPPFFWLAFYLSFFWLYQVYSDKWIRQ